MGKLSYSSGQVIGLVGGRCRASDDGGCSEMSGDEEEAALTSI